MSPVDSPVPHTLAKREPAALEFDIEKRSAFAEPIGQGHLGGSVNGKREALNVPIGRGHSGGPGAN